MRTEIDISYMMRTENELQFLAQKTNAHLARRQGEGTPNYPAAPLSLPHPPQCANPPNPGIANRNKYSHV